MIQGQENIPEPAVKYKFSSKLNTWVRTWFTIEEEKNKSPYFKQHNAFSKNRNTDWEKWQTKP